MHSVHPGRQVDSNWRSHGSSTSAHMEANANTRRTRVATRRRLVIWLGAHPRRWFPRLVSTRNFEEWRQILKKGRLVGVQFETGPSCPRALEPSCSVHSLSWGRHACVHWGRHAPCPSWSQDQKSCQCRRVNAHPTSGRGPHIG